MVNEIGIQQAARDAARSALAKYQDLVIGSRSFGKLIVYELVVLLAAWVPGALGLVLRKILYPLILGAVGPNTVFGQGVVLRHPGKIRIGRDVVVDDLVLIDAKGETNQGIA
jgi:serine acetyltransferase